MKKTINRKSTSSVFPSLQQGQVWELKDSNVHIAMVGKRLVHYKHFKGQVKRAAVSITSIPTLENYLEENKAVLIKKPSAAPTNPI